MNNILVTGMVISSMPIGEYDRRLELLTGEYGRISAFAKGARKPSSPLVSVSRLFAFGQFELFQGKSSYSVNSAKITNYFTELSEDVALTFYGSYFLELAQYFTRENVEATDTLKLIYQSLRALAHEGFDNRLVKGIYEIKMLALNGVCPPADRIIAGEGQFAFGRGISESCAYALEYVISSPIEKLYTFRLSEEVLKEFDSLSESLISMTVDKKFKSLELLESIKEVG